MAKVSVANSTLERNEEGGNGVYKKGGGCQAPPSYNCLCVPPHTSAPLPPLHLNKLLREQDLDELLQDGQQARVVHPDPSLQHRQHLADGGQLAVLAAQALHGIVVHLGDKVCGSVEEFIVEGGGLQ